MKRIENPKNTERGRNAIPPRQEFIFPTHLFFYFPFLTQLQTAFIIGTSYAIAKLAPKRGFPFNFGIASRYVEVKRKAPAFPIQTKLPLPSLVQV